MKCRRAARSGDGPKRQLPISLHPLKFEDVIRDVLTVKPPKKEKRQRSGKRQDRSNRR
jgi:hypothetical protein